MLTKNVEKKVYKPVSSNVDTGIEQNLWWMSTTILLKKNSFSTKHMYYKMYKYTGECLKKSL